MKKINATTTYDPNLSIMQEIEYTMPQAKKDIANCLMNALDNLKDQQAEIEHLELALEKNRTYWKTEVDKQQDEIDEAVNIITELHEQLKEERDDVIWLDAEDFIQQHKGE